MTRKATAEMAANAVIHYLKQSSITDKAEQEQWIAKVFQAVSAREDRAN